MLHCPQLSVATAKGGVLISLDLSISESLTFSIHPARCRSNRCLHPRLTGFRRADLDRLVLRDRSPILIQEGQLGAIVVGHGEWWGHVRRTKMSHNIDPLPLSVSSVRHPLSPAQLWQVIVIVKKIPQAPSLTSASPKCVKRLAFVDVCSSEGMSTAFVGESSAGSSS